MAIEIERKFLIDITKIESFSNGINIKQGYIKTAGNTVVRARIKGDQAFLTLKGENRGSVRSEFEYQIPVTDSEEIIAQLCNGPTIDKTRYEIQHACHLWELDIFHGDNEGLIVAEVELASEDDVVDLPDWVTEEVTGDSKYYNSSLIEMPFKDW